MAQEDKSPPVADVALRASHLTKRFGTHTAVRDVSFDVYRGEIFGFLGPNGAGKTTTVRMLTGILTPDEGTVSVDGLDLFSSLVQAKMRMGVIPEVGTIYVDLSAQQNIELTGRFYGMGKESIRRRSEELLRELGLYERRNDLVRTYSKGMRQRVSIACAIVHEPSLLFMDEPTEGLDVQSRRLIIATVRRMNMHGCTVFLTTHNIEEANDLCDRVCIINNGAVVALDRPGALKCAFDSTQSVEAVFEPAVGANKAGNVYCIKVDERGDRLVFQTDDPDATVRSAVSFAQESGLRIVSLVTCGPSLEDAFVALTEGSP